MVFYFVQRGETLYHIAKRYQTTVHAIVAANRLDDPNAICPGQALIIPRPGEVPSPPPGGIVHLVRAGETVFRLAAKFGTTALEILRANQIAHPEFVIAGQQLVIPERMEAGDDWPMLGRTPGRAGAGPVVLAGAPSEGWSFAPKENLGVRPSAPVIRYDRVYVGLGDGHFYALDRHTGRVKWRVPAGGTAAPGASPLATPAVFDGLVYLCSPDGDLFAVDAYSGEPIWRTVLGAGDLGSPTVARGVVYVGAPGGCVVALEAKTGAIAWRRDLGAPVRHPVALGDDHVFVCPDDGLLRALDAETGDVFWQVTAEQPGAPVFAEVLVLVGGRAYDPQNGEVLWRVSAGDSVPVARVDEIIYPGGVVDLFTGRPRRAPVAGQATAKAPASSPTPDPDALPVLPDPPAPVRSHITA
ncbi:MAG TPA: PQQ-binding-like beta-propeller repeat protein, partial [Symbiobacteriaceae bacterium]|nr:PQQ-binding-like beta-propeller repeat protein [Symbiobacteriaceae bacterium]